MANDHVFAFGSLPGGWEADSRDDHMANFQGKAGRFTYSTCTSRLRQVDSIDEVRRALR